MTTITLTAGSEEELVRKAAKARAATAGALKRLAAAIRGRPYAGNITIDLTPPDLYTTPHDIHIAEDGTITAALLPNVNAHLTVKVATSSGAHRLDDILCELDEEGKPVYLWLGQTHRNPEQVAVLIKGEIDRILARDRQLERARRIAEALQPVLSGPLVEAR